MWNLKFTWALLRVIWDSKGYSMKEMPARLQRKWPERKGVAFASIQRKAQEGRRAPRDIAAFVISEQTLPTRKGYEKPFKLDTANAKLDTANAKLDVLQATVADTAVKLEKLLAEHRRRRLTWGFGAAGLLLLAVLFGGSRTQANQSEVGHAATMSANQAPQVGKVANGVTGWRFDLWIFLGAILEMGKKPEENWIPKQPLPGQKLAKDCKASLGEEPINGGCWVPVDRDFMTPPCGDLFRHGNKCYRPASADPTKPIGVSPVAPDQP